MLKNKKLYFVSLIMAVMILLPVSSFTALASSSDMTNKMSKNRQINKTVKQISVYTTALFLDGIEEKGTTKIDLTANRKLSIAALTRFQFKYDDTYTAKELKKTTKDLFGKGIDIQSVKLTKSDYICKNGRSKKNPYRYNGGEFGDMIPTYQILKIVKIGKVYEVTFKNQYTVYGEKGITTLGTTTLQLQKNKKSEYVVKSIAYTK